jgi:hypothetical protein
MITLSLSCEIPDELKLGEEACTQMGWVEVLAINISFNNSISDDYSVEIDDQKIESCSFGSSPCILNETRISEKEIKMAFEMYDTRTSIDLNLSEAASDNLRISKKDITLDWNISSFPNSTEECGIQNHAQIQIAE